MFVLYLGKIDLQIQVTHISRIAIINEKAFYTKSLATVLRCNIPFYDMELTSKKYNLQYYLKRIEIYK